jgi:RNA polymerase sigma-70 factor, ECF subfamily
MLKSEGKPQNSEFSLYLNLRRGLWSYFKITLMDTDDRQIIADLKLDNKKDLAFHMLVKKYQERLYWHIRKIVMNHEDADDVLQNTFVKVWRSIDNFREESSLYTWLYRIATNESLTFLNSNKRRSFMPINDVSEYLMKNLMSDPYFEGDEIQLKLQEAILKLPDKQRTVFNMKYFDEMKYEEMSKILDTSVGALKASYHHAAKKIEEYLKSTD